MVEFDPKAPYKIVAIFNSKYFDSISAKAECGYSGFCQEDWKRYGCIVKVMSFEEWKKSGFENQTPLATYDVFNHHSFDESIIGSLA